MLRSYASTPPPLLLLLSSVGCTCFERFDFKRNEMIHCESTVLCACSSSVSHAFILHGWTCGAAKLGRKSVAAAVAAVAAWLVVVATICVIIIVLLASSVAVGACRCCVVASCRVFVVCLVSFRYMSFLFQPFLYFPSHPSFLIFQCKDRQARSVLKG